MKKKVFATAASVLSLGALTVGCVATNNTTNNGTTGVQPAARTAAANVKVGLVTDTGGLNDNSFNHLAYVGMQKAQNQLGIKTSVVQSNAETDYVPNLSRYAQQGYSLVIAVGFLMQQAVEKVSAEYPNTKFLIIDSAITDRKNVTSAMFQTEQAGYLVGALSGLLQTSKALPHLNTKNTVGVVGGTEIPPVDSYIAGFQQGFKKEDPTGKVIVKYTGSFTDQTLGSQFAQSEISQGADIIFPVAGGCGIGSINAAKSANLYAIGVDTNQAYLAPKNVLTSAMKGVDTSVFDTIKAVKAGNFKSGVSSFSLSNQGVGMAPVLKGVPANIVAKVNALKAQIAAGKIKISTTVQK